jgi:hypothetical protein
MAPATSDMTGWAVAAALKASVMTLPASAPLATAIAVNTLPMPAVNNLSTMLTVFSFQLSVVLRTLPAAFAYVNNNLEIPKRTLIFFNSARMNCEDSVCRKITSRGSQ